MDPKLAEMYGTNTPDDADLEKLAAAELADQLSDDGAMDLDGIDPEALEALAAEVLNDGSEGEGDQVKLAEADYLGRVMAHAYVQELKGIEKEAGPVTRGLKGFASKAMGGLKDIATGSQARAAHKVVGSEAKKGAVAERILKNSAKSGADKPSDALKAAREKAKKGVDRLQMARKERAKGVAKTVGLYGAGAAGAGAAGKKAFEKKSSALETLIEQRAREILAENGIDPDGQEKTSNADFDVLANVVEQQAWELLAANGFVSDEE